MLFVVVFFSNCSSVELCGSQFCRGPFVNPFSIYCVIKGVVRVGLLEAKDLMAKDTYMMGLVKGKSDPYAVLRVGNAHHKSKTIKENLNPHWNETYEVWPVHLSIDTMFLCMNYMYVCRSSIQCVFFICPCSLWSMKLLDKSWRLSFLMKTQTRMIN